ncbi:unnamed protein product, partial [Brassica rapa subsp. narinosa]
MSADLGFLASTPPRPRSGEIGLVASSCSLAAWAVISSLTASQRFDGALNVDEISAEKAFHEQ